MAKSVLIYEDDPSFQNQFRNVFFSIKEEFCLLEAYNNTIGLEEHIRMHHPDIILMDIQMDEDDEGIVALYKIKNLFPHIKVMMLTSFDVDESIFNAMCLGADGYMLKSDFTSSFQLPHETLRKSLRVIFDGGAYMTPSVAKRVLNFFSNPSLPQFITAVKARFSNAFKRKENGSGAEAGLTKKQLIVLKKLAEGKTAAEIAQEMELTDNTINTHIKGIYSVLEVHNRTSAIKKAIEAKIIS